MNQPLIPANPFSAKAIREQAAILATKRPCPHCHATVMHDKRDGIEWAVSTEHEPGCPDAS